MVNSQQTDSDTAMAVRSFLAWVIDGSKGGTSQNLQAVGFVALPTAILPGVMAAIAKIGS
jgi:hypothetical protein